MEESHTGVTPVPTAQAELEHGPVPLEPVLHCSPQRGQGRAARSTCGSPQAL